MRWRWSPARETDAAGVERVLLCRRGIEPRVGKWGFPQGFLEHGESTRAGAAREAMEEAGAAVEPGPMLACYNLPGQVQLLYMATVPPGGEEPPTVECGEESLEAKFFAWDEMPEDEELAFPTVKWALQYARDVAVPCLQHGYCRWGTGFVPQQRTKLFFGAPEDGVGYVDETAPP